jgi:hypothetical protein
MNSPNHNAPGLVHELVGQPADIDNLADHVDAYFQAMHAVVALARVVCINSQPSHINLTALRHSIKALDIAEVKYQGNLDGSIAMLPNTPHHRPAAPDQSPGQPGQEPDGGAR